MVELGITSLRERLILRKIIQSRKEAEIQMGASGRSNYSQHYRESEANSNNDAIKSKYSKVS